jgi:hypothetical protein
MTPRASLSLRWSDRERRMVDKAGFVTLLAKGKRRRSQMLFNNGVGALEGAPNLRRYIDPSGLLWISGKFDEPDDPSLGK